MSNNNNLHLEYVESVANKNLKVPSHCSCCLTVSFRNFALVDDDTLSKKSHVENAYFSGRVTRESTYTRVRGKS